MISIVKYLFEAKTHGYSGYTKGDMKSGYGKMIGGSVGSIPGSVASVLTGVPGLGNITALPGIAAGHLVGKSATSEKEKKEPIDERKRSHRVGVIGSEMYRGKRMGKYAGIGAGTGAALGAIAALANSDADPEAIGKLVGGGAGGGAMLGAGISSMVGAHKAAKKLGYGRTGRILAPTIGGALTGLTKPKQIKDEEKKVIEKHSK